MASRTIPRKLVWIAIWLWAAVSNCTLHSGDTSEEAPDAGTADAGMVLPVELPRIDSEIPEFYHDQRYVAGTLVVLSQRYEVLELGVRPVTVGPDIKLEHELFIRRATAALSNGAVDILTVAPDVAHDQDNKLLLYTVLAVRDDGDVTEFRATEKYQQMAVEEQQRKHAILYEIWEYKGFGRGYALVTRFTLGVSYSIPRPFAALCWEADAEGDMSAHVIWDYDG